MNSEQTQLGEPRLGDIIQARLIGRNLPYIKYIWAKCIGCGRERWVVLLKGKPRFSQCHPCSLEYHRHHMMGANNPGWKNDRCRFTKHGYIFIKLRPDNFFYPMANTYANTNYGGYVQEHRLVIAKSISRCLQPWEIVHHKNGIKDDNRLTNLQLIDTSNEHSAKHFYSSIHQVRVIQQLQKRIERLEAELASYKDGHKAIAQNA